MAYFAPRGAGPTSWAALSPTKQTQLRRRLLLLGESLESGQVWDITRAAMSYTNKAKGVDDDHI